jgi:hypothetical protein
MSINAGSFNISHSSMSYGKLQGPLYWQASETLPSSSKGLNTSFYLPASLKLPCDAKKIDAAHYLPIRCECSYKTSSLASKKITAIGDVFNTALLTGLLVLSTFLSLYSAFGLLLAASTSFGWIWKLSNMHPDVEKNAQVPPHSMNCIRGRSALADAHAAAPIVGPSAQNLQKPARYGIASYFPGHTALNSLVSYSTIPELNKAVPIGNALIDESPVHMKKWRSVAESKNIQMLPTAHCAETHDWRKALVQAAEHNIVISGNYCGQTAFDEILELIREKLEQNENLKVVIISSPNFVKDIPEKNIENQTLIAELKQRFPAQFSVVYSPDVWMMEVGAGCKRTTNHTKYFGIDWGRYYVMGGSAIKDNFNMSGTDSITKILSDEENVQLAHFEEMLSNLQEEWERPNANLAVIREKIQECLVVGESVKHTLSHSPNFSREYAPVLEKLSSIPQLIRQEFERETPLAVDPDAPVQLKFNPQIDLLIDSYDDDLFGMIVPGNFRDMDFVFSDPNDGYSSGRQLFLEMVRLAYYWESLNASHENNHAISSFTPTEVAHLPIFTQKEAQDPESTDSVAHRIMREPMPKSSKVHTRKVGGFEKSQIGSLQMLYQGPEQLSGTSEFSSKVLELIKNAKEKIVIDHMYFCPTDAIMEALREAIENRGVQVEIITCARTEDCPNNQKVFGPYNKWNWVKLANQLSPEHRQNLKVFLFTEKQKGLHKKVIVFDEETVLAGSSNLGYKSLVTSSDHEINFIAKSKGFADKTLKICEQDKKLSQEITNTTEISLVESLQAVIYSGVTPFVN